MHNAPAVSYPVGRSRFQVLFLSIISVLGMSAAVTWIVQAQTPDWRQGLMLSGAVLTGFGAVWHWRHAPIGQLSWEGSSWSWAASGHTEPVQLAVVVDLQMAILLMLRPNGAKVRWLWVQRDASPVRWLPLRRAVYQRPRVDQDPLRDASRPEGNQA